MTEKQSQNFDLNILPLVVALIIMGSLGLCGDGCRDTIHAGIRGTVEATR